MDKISLLQTKRSEALKEAIVRATKIKEVNTKSPSTSDTNILNLKDSDTKYTISKIYDLKRNNITIPKNCILEFTSSGGFKNGTITGNGTIIIANHKIFDNVTIEGSWGCVGRIEWFAEECKIYSTTNKTAYYPSRTDSTNDLLSAFNSAFHELVFPPRIYYITHPLVLEGDKKLTFEGGKMRLSLAQSLVYLNNISVIYSDKDITLLKIKGDTRANSSIEINGGHFDVSLTTLNSINYGSNVIEVLCNNNEKLWGLNINTNVYGPYTGCLGTGIAVNPTSGLYGGYVTMVRINSDIVNFKTGIDLRSYDAGTKNWLTDVKIDGCIISCIEAIHVEDVGHVGIYASVQPDYLFSTKENGQALIYLDCDQAYVDGVIWDLGQYRESTGLYTHLYGIHIVREDANIVASDDLLAQISNTFGRNLIKGYSQCLVTQGPWKAANPYDYRNGTYDMLHDAFLGWDLILPNTVEFSLVENGGTRQNVIAYPPNNMFRDTTTGTTITASQTLGTGDYFEIKITPDSPTRISNIFVYIANISDLSGNYIECECEFKSTDLNYTSTIKRTIQFGTLNVAPVLNFFTAVLYSWDIITLRFYCSGVSLMKILRISGFRPLSPWSGESGIDSSYISRVGGTIYGNLEVKGTINDTKIKFVNNIPVFWNSSTNLWVNSQGNIIE